MKKLPKIIREFLDLDEQKRNAIFQIHYTKVPTTEARARILCALPLEEAVRIVNSIKCFEMGLCLEFILSTRNGKKFFLKLFPEILTKRLVEILGAIGGFPHWKDIFNFLPIKTIALLIDCAVEMKIKGESDTFDVYHPVQFLVASREEVAKKVLNRIKPISFEKIAYYDTNLGQDIFLTYVSTLSSRRISNLCMALSPTKAYKILSRIQNVEKQKAVLSLLPLGFRSVFFTNAGKNNKNANIAESDLDIVNLPFKSKQLFVKKFPRSKQIARLPFEERLELKFANG